MTDQPPDDAYGRVTNPERFALLVDVGKAAMADLETQFEVTVERDGDPLLVFPHAKPGWLNGMIRLVPVDRAAAELAMAFTDFPAVVIKAGLWVQRTFPSCGCDACNEDPDEEAKYLRECLYAVVSGHLTELIETRFPNAKFHTYRWEAPGKWHEANTTRLGTAEFKRIQHSDVRIPSDGRWHPWPHLSDNVTSSKEMSDA